PTRISKLGVDLQGLLGTVDVVAVDASNHVSVLNPDLRVERIRTDREQFEALRLSILESGDDPGLHRQLVQVRKGFVDLGPGDLVFVIPRRLDARSNAAGVWLAWPDSRWLGRRITRHCAVLVADVLAAVVVEHDDALAQNLENLGSENLVPHAVGLGALGTEIQDGRDRQAANLGGQRSEQLDAKAAPRPRGRPGHRPAGPVPGLPAPWAAAGPSTWRGARAAAGARAPRRCAAPPPSAPPPWAGAR